MKIFITGFAGCGKSTYGRFLADWLQMAFIDLDDKIIELEQRSINEIFSESNGEALFRNIESQHLKKIIQSFEHFVMATGGGTPCYHNNMELMNSAGTTIFLDVSKSVLQERLLQCGTNRPLIKDLTDVELKQYIDETLLFRLPFYSQCKIRVCPEKISISKLLQILEADIKIKK